MNETRRAKSWVEVILMPLVVAVVGTMGTYLVTSEQRKSAELIAEADRQIRIIEIFADKITSADENERLLAIGLTGTLDAELSARIMTIAIDQRREKSEAVREAIDNLTSQAIASRVAATKVRTENRGAIIEGRWLLRRQGVPPSETKIVNWLEFKAGENGLTVRGDLWEGEVTFDGKRGHYLWKFKDGRTGRTDIYLDSTGILFGRVKGSGIDWTYWASREISAARANRAPDG